MIIKHDIGQYVKILEPGLRARVDEIKIVSGHVVNYNLSYWDDNRIVQVTVEDDEVEAWTDGREPLIICQHHEQKTKK